MPLYKPGRRMRPPTHPGEVLEEAIEALGLSVSQAARDLGVTRQFLYRLLKGQVAVSPEMALKIGRFCGNGPNLWLNMQASYDLWHAEQKLGAKLKAVPERHKTAA